MHPSQLAAVARQQKALEMRLAGHTFADIGKALGYSSHRGAMEAVHAVLRRQEAEPAERVRQTEIAALRKMRATLWRRAIGATSAVVVHDEKGRGVAAMTQETAFDRWLKAGERLARLAGLDAPTKTEVRATYSEAELWQLVAEVRGVVRDVVRERCGADVAEAVDADLGVRLGARSSSATVVAEHVAAAALDAATDPPEAEPEDAGGP